jgi:hypothetical protein
MIAAELAWLAISVPPQPGRYRHTCPWCSATRAKHYERCLVVDVLSDRAANVYCHHCQIEKEVDA